VYPVFVIFKVHEWESTIMDSLKRLENIDSGDMVLLTQGQAPGDGKSGGTNFLKFIVAE
jgi:pyruvate kinase